MGDQGEHILLSEYLDQVQQAIKAALPGSCWIVAELSAIKGSAKGHVYLDLLESSNGGEVAKAKAVMFAAVARSVQGKWQEATGGHPQPGMKLLLQVKSDFSVQYGFSLQVTAIDPAYTLGDMQMQLQRLIASLQAKGWFDLQRHLAQPRGYWRIAVISPHEAAGLADFRRDADQLSKNGVCDFEYFSAVFQGRVASSSIRSALGQVHERHQENPFDVVCIIRGGGSKADLAWLNDANLAAWVCRLPIPIYTGIGHEIDECVLDMVAHRRFDTPSKVIGHFRSIFQQEAAYLRFTMERITAGLLRLVEGERGFLNQSIPLFAERSQWKLAQERQRLNMGQLRFANGQRQMVDLHKSLLHRVDNYFERLATQKCSYQSMHLQQLDNRFQSGARALVAREHGRLSLAAALFDKTNPLALLNKGFALVRSSEGEVIASASSARKAHELTLTFADGIVPVCVGQSSTLHEPG